MNDPKRIAIVAISLVLLGLCCLGIKNKMESAGYQKQVAYVTAIQLPDKDRFNYTIDSQQGRVFANADFSADGRKLAKFPEMKQGFTFVERTKEHYTAHTTTTCNSKGSCTTSTYYSWDAVESEEQEVNGINMNGRVYPAGLFNYDKYKQDSDACAYTDANSAKGWFASYNGCVDGDFYLSSDDRYSYRTVPTSFNATFLATTYGGLSPYKEKAITLENKSPEQVLKDIGQYKLYAFWTLLVVLVILTIAAGVIAYNWVMADGMWSLHR